MSYQGWKNYESWAVGLWLDNDQSLQREAQRVVNREANIYRAADALKTFVTEDVLPDLGASLAQDLLNAAVSEVDWQEVAEHFKDEDEEEDADDDEESGDAALVPATPETWPKGIDTL
jgi:hypothetical protein